MVDSPKRSSGSEVYADLHETGKNSPQTRSRIKMGRMEARDSDKHEAAMFFMVPMKCQIARRERGREGEERREMGEVGLPGGI